LRSLSVEGLARLRARVGEVAAATAAVHGCGVASLTFAPDPYLPTVNNPALFRSVSDGLAASGVALTEVAPCLAGEDFGFIAAKVPAAFLLIGQGGAASLAAGDEAGGLCTAFGLHHPRFAIDEAVLAAGVALHAHLAASSLSDLAA